MTMHGYEGMTVALQIRDVPDEVRDLLAEQARRDDQSVQTYLRRLVEREARPSAEDWGPCSY